MSADSSIMSQWPDDEQQQDSSNAYALSGRIMLASIITLFVIVFFLILLHLYSRWYLTRLHRRHDTRRTNPSNRSTRLVYYVDNNNNRNNRALASGSTGLDTSVVNSLPLFVYSSRMKTKTNESTIMLECAVCLSEFEEGETGRVLPNCKHVFHTGCIDMWFGSHSTCPLCRSPVEPVQTEVKESVRVSVPVPEPGSSASLMETTSSEDRRKRVDVRIDVPVSESVTESPSQGLRSPGSRLLSFKMIMNMSRLSVGPSCDSVATELDVDSARQESDQESSRPGGLG